MGTSSSKPPRSISCDSRAMSMNARMRTRSITQRAHHDSTCSWCNPGCGGALLLILGSGRPFRMSSIRSP